MITTCPFYILNNADNRYRRDFSKKILEKLSFDKNQFATLILNSESPNTHQPANRGINDFSKLIRPLSPYLFYKSGRLKAIEVSDKK
ncbi:MAG: hypothetical protein A3H57_02520 [Candidatus Taylorbacteria bacterium RIFCSPLOWO2_02_FULL_43_11]|uniref:Uncharacterized protein n=1 Tax=Candidatus Taylorbacteria bacterium RIFCSPHIGHO2_02_FULL_43_32b TaxID=1802306 RepID=A0A1G2MII1_9BACT|nr:MAG: hypothetical protein A2743_00275 [Candidatus Taylorbacteria bacterium RIFCSPHIGHO2_01_FULL_43_47]OHA22802.1 MAG: hypothetical protein A3C72_02715 [Candidatus Taylorbacteria bacterium RIFCSPHIGHO2_02_FULL_43_32b]OHA35253.1 MAG: hypothetical protein A3H57_02520 [Candidatus Taylorbacteria bacterium RIFCSPLOWO2_02_FULL_43_11]